MELLQNLMPPTTLGIFVLAMIVLLCIFVLFVKRNSGGYINDRRNTSEETVDDYVAMHGEPEEIMVTDATRSNELNAVILVYENEIVIEGQPVQRDKITNVTFYNAQNPYLEKEFHLVISTSVPETPTIETPIGSDAESAKEITARLMSLLSL